jgi:hypothetical protein
VKAFRQLVAQPTNSFLSTVGEDMNVFVNAFAAVQKQGPEALFDAAALLTKLLEELVCAQSKTVVLLSASGAALVMLGACFETGDAPALLGVRCTLFWCGESWQRACVKNLGPVKPSVESFRGFPQCCTGTWRRVS